MPAAHAAALTWDLDHVAPTSTWILGRWRGNRPAPLGSMTTDVLWHDVWWETTEVFLPPMPEQAVAATTATGAHPIGIDLPYLALAADGRAVVYADIDLPVLVLGVSARPSTPGWTSRDGLDECSLDELIGRTT